MNWIQEPSEEYDIPDLTNEDIETAQIEKALDAGLSRYRYLTQQIEEFEARYKAELAELKSIRDRHLEPLERELEAHRDNINTLMDSLPGKTFKGVRGKISQRDTPSLVLEETLDVNELPVEYLTFQASKSSINKAIMAGELEVTDTGEVVNVSTGEKLSGVKKVLKRSTSIKTN